MATDVFDAGTTTVDTSTADTAILQKRIVDKDAFIETLKSENAAAREAVAAEERKRKALEDILLKNADTQKTATNQDTRTPQVVEAPSDADLSDRISRLTKEERERERIQVNIDTVAARLVAVYGSEEKAKEVVATKARELGVSTKFLQQVAAASPNAFFKQMDLSSTTKPIVPNASKGTVNTEAMGRNNQSQEPERGTYGYFTRLRETEGMAKFLSPKVQNEMHKAVLEWIDSGKDEADFYKT